MSNQTETLVKMINQIADNAPKKGGPNDTARVVAGHVQKFWAKPMKAEIKAHLAGGGDGLNEVAASAVRQL